MSVISIPADRIARVRYHLIGQELGHDATSPDGQALETVLAKLAELANPGPRALTKASLADAVEEAERTLKALRTAQVCWCGHKYADHVGRGGCFECDVCFGASPSPVKPTVVNKVGDQVIVINGDSKYYARTGLAIARDENGLLVQLDKTGERIHFEQSELGARRHWPRLMLTDPKLGGK